MEKKFGEFFQDKNYIKVKNSLFNYLNRKKEIKNAFLKFSNVEKALDIGSGISPVSPIPNKTLFMDLSPEGIEILNNQGYNAKVGSITKILEKENSFDFIFCSEVLEHIENYKKAITEMVRVLEKQGKILITIPVHMRYWHSDDQFVEHYRRFNPKELKKDLENSGLKILEEKPIGSLVERYLTLGLVKMFKNSKDKPVDSRKMPLYLIVNKILYYIVRVSLRFNSKKNTSIMLYVCEKE